MHAIKVLSFVLSTFWKIEYFRLLILAEVLSIKKILNAPYDYIP